MNAPSAVEPPPPGPPPGTVLGGKYTIERVLGVGGMGVVLAARHLHLDQSVAIKLLLPEAAQNEGVVARFVREGRTASSIKSEHVVRVFDVDVFPPWGPALVLEMLQGRDLDAVVSDGAIPVPQAVDYLLQACEAIAEAHALGIVHRDLKPHNLFLTQRADGTACVKVLDFGISKVAGRAGDSRLTSTGMIFGTPSYMAPEQMRESRDTDARTDIWALGAILFELCAGRPPFVANSLTELTARVLIDEAPRLRSLGPGAPRELDAAIARCLEKDPARRFQDVAELARAVAGCGTAQARASAERIASVLARAGSGAGGGAAVDPLARTALPQSTLAPSTTTTPTARRGAPAGVGIAVGLGLGLGVAAGVLYFALRQTGKVEPVTAATTATAITASSQVAMVPPVASTSAAPAMPSVAAAQSASADPTPSSSAAPQGAPVKPHAGPKPSSSSKPGGPVKTNQGGIAHDRDG